jgi:hypothetical protein
MGAESTERAESAEDSAPSASTLPSASVLSSASAPSTLYFDFSALSASAFLPSGERL